MDWALNRLPKRLHHKVITKYYEGDYNYLRLTLQVHKIIPCMNCVNRKTVNQWIKYAINEGIWKINEQV